MPKMKTRKCAAKRLKQTGTGKFMRNQAGKRHILTHKSAKRRHRLSSSIEVKKSELRRVQAALPYGLN